jgi:Ferredoxin-like domain in Api92-like protein
MPNHVTHKILFSADKLDAVKAVICTGDCIDFEKLIPSPPQKYHGNTNSTDEEDFPCNWYSWNLQNWGTKWNAYQGSLGQAEDGRAFLKFDTAWSIPYPVMSAFANRFAIPFEHRYYDEGHNFWGIERWDIKWGETLQRVEKLFKRPEDDNPLSIELKGWDRTKDEDAA